MKERPIIIVFLGIDGSGKTTLSQYLYDELKKREIKVMYLWWLEGENTILKRFLKKFRKIHKLNPPIKTNPNIQPTKKKNIAMKLFYVIYPKFVLLNYLLFGIVKVWIPKITRAYDILILDRYICDVVLAISREFNYPYAKMVRLLKLFYKLLPEPSLIFIIEVPPEVAYSRKKEEFNTMKNAKQLWKNYHTLYSIIYSLSPDKIIKVDNSKNIKITKIKILKTTLNTMNIVEGV